MSMHQLEATCQELISRLEAVKGTSRREPELSANISRTKARIQKLRQETRQPIRVGLVGAFNSGKTRLTEAMLGCGGLLNVADKPSTGNIVEFTLSVRPQGRTELRGWRVVFMDEREQAGPILRRLLAHAHGLLQQLQRDMRTAPIADTLGELLRKAEFSADEAPRWTNAIKWARETHKQEYVGRQLQALAFEVYRLAYTVGQATGWMGLAFDISEAQAIVLMSLSYDPREIYTRPLQQWVSPVPPPPADGLLANLSAEQLRALFPIVGKITVNAYLPPSVARPFFADTEVVSDETERSNEVRLVDCPGAGADGSNFRDEILCAEELKDVDAVLALLNAKNVGENRGFVDELIRLWGRAAKNRILAVVSRFDDLGHDGDASRGKRDELAGEKGALTAATLYQQIPILDDLLKAAKDMVIDYDLARVSLVSAMGYFFVSLATDPTVERSTVDFRTRQLGFPDDAGKQPWVKEMVAWYRIGERLALSTDDESRDLAEMFKDFGEDGGLGRVHRSWQRQLSSALIYDRLRPQVEREQQIVTELEAQCAALPPPETSAEPTVATSDLEYPQALRLLAEAYERLESKLSGESFPLERRLEGSNEVADVLEPIRQWATRLIFDWQQLRSLLERVDDDGLVELFDPDQAQSDTERRHEAPPPVHSLAFLTPFTETLRKVYNDGLRVRCQAAFQHHAMRLQEKLEREIGGRTRLEEIVAVLNSTENQSLRHDESLASLLTATERALPDLLPKIPETSEQSLFDPYFPLQKDEKFYYAWTSGLYRKHRRQFPDRYRHMMYVIRLRQALVTAMLYWLDDRARDAQLELTRRLVNLVKDNVHKLRSELNAIPEQRPDDDLPID